MKKQTRRFGLLATTSFCSAMVAGVLTTVTGGIAQAQDAAPKTEAPTAKAEESIQEVIVTGSRIRRNPTNAPAPLIQVTRENILQSGAPNVIDQLADVPALIGSTVPEDTTANLNTGGLSLLNLRWLGASRTLVLVDGRRHVGAQQGSLSVDVDTIPRLLIERIDVTTGGQSALYGADAVAGVVNFVMRKDFEGLEIDSNVSQINQDGQTQKRFSALAGKNFFDNRLNTYISAEYEEGEELNDADIDWRRNACQLVANDADPSSAVNDGVNDNVLKCGVRNISRAKGGYLVLANQIPQSMTSDPDRGTSSLTCAYSPSAPFGGAVTNCFNGDPGRAFVFDASGKSRAANYGTFRQEAGAGRTLNVGGDGLNPLTEFAQGSRVPESLAARFQTGFNFKITDDILAFGELKYVREESYFRSQGSFFSIGVYDVPANQMSYCTSANALCNTTSGLVISTGTDNPFLDPALKTLIQGNIRQNYGGATATADGQPTTKVADPRALLTNFGPLRTQTNNREVTRFVLGVKGEKDEFLFAKNLSWELSYTGGKAENNNNEFGLDIMRYWYGADAVTDTLGKVNGKPGEAVCRVQLLAANGVTIADRFRGGTLDPNSAEVKQCVPFSIYGDGQNEPKARAYYDASINVSHVNNQKNFIAFVSGELWDFWGAGPIGVALGHEYRFESAVGVGRTTSTGNRFLFLNTGADFPYSEYDVTEKFGEVRIPLLKDLPLAKSLEFSAAARRSDYSTVGKVETWSTQAMWTINDQLTIRGTRGFATRIPNLSEAYSLQTQTFANGFVDPCDARNINNLTNTELKGYRLANCAAIGIPAGQIMNYTSTSVGGFQGGNPLLKPEESLSKTLSLIVRPKILPRTSFVFDWYNIVITNVIGSVTAQTLVNQCVSNPAVNRNACNQITRNPANEYQVISFIQGSLNYAKSETQGMDFTIAYRQPLDNVFGKDFGSMSFSLKGNYEQFNRSYTNIDLPNFPSDFAGSLEEPMVRLATSVAWNYRSDLSFYWNMDFQSAQEILDIDDYRRDPDNRDLEYYTTGDFIQHDFSVRWEVKPGVTLRGGVVNAFDAEPAPWLGNTSAENFDQYGRRFYVGFNFKR